MTGTGPEPPAQGRSQRWELFGTVGVDSASLAITDPGLCNTLPTTIDDLGVRNGQQYGQWMDGVAWWSGFGDGSYEVWGLIVDYGTGEHPDERVAQVVVTMIDQAELDDWNQG